MAKSTVPLPQVPVYTKREEVPILDIRLPRPLIALHQIELTSRCSLRCVYCVSPDIVKGKYPSRPATDLSEANLRRAMEHVKLYVEQKTQVTVNLAGIGESMMRDDFIDLLRVARSIIPFPPLGFVLATNGLHMTKAKAEEMRALGTFVWVSMHRPEKAGPAIEIAKAAGILLGVSDDPATNADDWAQQVAWFRSQPYITPCTWLRDGRAMVLADGRIAACCLDAKGEDSIIGHVDDPVGSLRNRPYSLCDTCQQVIAIKGVTQNDARR